MKRAVLMLVLGTVFLQAGPARARVSADVKVLPLRRAVSSLGAGAAGPGIHLEVVEDSLLAAGSRAQLADVRIVDAEGRSQPFLSRPPRLRDERWEERPLVPLSPEASNGVRGWSLSGSLEATLSLVVTVPEGRDAASLRIERATGRGEWETVPARARVPSPRARGLDPGDFGQEVVLLRTVASLGVRILDPTGILENGEDPRVYVRTEAPVPRGAVRFRTESAGFAERTWRVSLALEGPPRALAGLVVEGDGSVGFQPTRIEVRIADGSWRRVTLAREESDPPRRTAWMPVRGDAVRFEVPNADPPHAPLEVKAIEIVPHRFAFRPPERGGELWIAYGDAHVAEASWPADPVTEPTAVFVPVAMGPPEASPWFEPPGFGLEWLKRHPAALTGLMAAILALLALVAWRTRERAGERP